MRTHHLQPTGCRRRPPGIAAAGAAASYLVFVNDGTIAGVGVATPPLFLDGAMGQPYDATTAEVVVTTSDPGPYTAAALR